MRSVRQSLSANNDEAHPECHDCGFVPSSVRFISWLAVPMRLMMSMMFCMQEELVTGKYMRSPADAGLADKGRAKGRKANKRAAGGAASLQGFRKYSSPSGIQVNPHLHDLLIHCTGPWASNSC